MVCNLLITLDSGQYTYYTHYTLGTPCIHFSSRTAI